MDRSILAMVFTQILEGWDIPTPTSVLRMTAKRASTEVPALPYSVLTNLAHAVYWQTIWLDQLRGEKPRPQMEVWQGDWKTPPSLKWSELRDQFKAGLIEAKRIAQSEPFDHKMANDEKAVDVLVRIAIHASYHLGQMNLIKRSLKQPSGSA